MWRHHRHPLSLVFFLPVELDLNAARIIGIVIRDDSGWYNSRITLDLRCVGSSPFFIWRAFETIQVAGSRPFMHDACDSIHTLGIQHSINFEFISRFELRSTALTRANHG